MFYEDSRQETQDFINDRLFDAKDCWESGWRTDEKRENKDFWDDIKAMVLREQE